MFVVLGGMGNILGSVISATVLYILPEAMRGLQDYRMIIYAIVLILVMLVYLVPQGQGCGVRCGGQGFRACSGKQKKEAAAHE